VVAFRKIHGRQPASQKSVSSFATFIGSVEEVSRCAFAHLRGANAARTRC
jgi:hypothetical protein